MIKKIETRLVAPQLALMIITVVRSSIPLPSVLDQYFIYVYNVVKVPKIYKETYKYKEYSFGDKL